MADDNKTIGKMYIFFNIEYHFNRVRKLKVILFVNRGGGSVII